MLLHDALPMAALWAQVVAVLGSKPFIFVVKMSILALKKPNFGARSWYCLAQMASRT